MATLTQVKHIGRTNAKQYDYDDGVSILVSYSAPVALYVSGANYYQVTLRYHSQTTQRHIKKWVGYGVERIPVQQEWLTYEFNRRGGVQ